MSKPVTLYDDPLPNVDILDVAPWDERFEKHPPIPDDWNADELEAPAFHDVHDRLEWFKESFQRHDSDQLGSCSYLEWLKLYGFDSHEYHLEKAKEEDIFAHLEKLKEHDFHTYEHGSSNLSEEDYKKLGDLEAAIIAILKPIYDKQTAERHAKFEAQHGMQMSRIAQLIAKKKLPTHVVPLVMTLAGPRRFS